MKQQTKITLISLIPQFNGENRNPTNRNVCLVDARWFKKLKNWIFSANSTPIEPINNEELAERIAKGAPQLSQCPKPQFELSSPNLTATTNISISPKTANSNADAVEEGRDFEIVEANVFEALVRVFGGGPLITRPYMAHPATKISNVILHPLKFRVCLQGVYYVRTVSPDWTVFDFLISFSEKIKVPASNMRFSASTVCLNNAARLAEVHASYGLDLDLEVPLMSQTAHQKAMSQGGLCRDVPCNSLLKSPRKPTDRSDRSVRSDRSDRSGSSGTFSEDYSGEKKWKSNSSSNEENKTNTFTFRTETPICSNVCTGNLNCSKLNSGNLNSGNLNSGNLNSGNLNSGNLNKGNLNNGNINSGNSSGCASLRHMEIGKELKEHTYNVMNAISFMIAKVDTFREKIISYCDTEQVAAQLPTQIPAQLQQLQQLQFQQQRRRRQSSPADLAAKAEGGVERKEEKFVSLFKNYIQDVAENDGNLISALSFSPRFFLKFERVPSTANFRRFDTSVAFCQLIESLSRETGADFTSAAGLSIIGEVRCSKCGCGNPSSERTACVKVDGACMKQRHHAKAPKKANLADCFQEFLRMRKRKKSNGFACEKCRNASRAGLHEKVRVSDVGEFLVFFINRPISSSASFTSEPSIDGDNREAAQPLLSASHHSASNVVFNTNSNTNTLSPPNFFSANSGQSYTTNEMSSTLSSCFSSSCDSNGQNALRANAPSTFAVPSFQMPVQQQPQPQQLQQQQPQQSQPQQPQPQPQQPQPQHQQQPQQSQPQPQPQQQQSQLQQPQSQLLQQPKKHKNKIFEVLYRTKFTITKRQTVNKADIDFELFAVIAERSAKESSMEIMMREKEGSDKWTRYRENEEAAITDSKAVILPTLSQVLIYRRL